MKKVSIIVAVFNIEDYIEECIVSLINQTYDCIEIILVNDGSFDKSVDICNKYAKENPKVKVIHKENGGLSEARNTGVMEATGDYLLFVDGDDMLDKKAVMTLVWLLEENNADMSSIIKSNHQYLSGEILVGHGKRMLLHMMNTACFEIWGKLFKKELFDDVEFPKDKIHEDLYTLPKLVLKCDKVVVYHKGMYYYRQREDSIMMNAIKNGLIELVECCIGGITECCQLSDDKKFVRNMQKWYLYHILWYYYNVVCNLDKIHYKKAANNIKIFYKRTRWIYIMNPEIKVKDKIRFMMLSFFA